MTDEEKRMNAASELEKKILELIKQEEPSLYSSDVAFFAIKLLSLRFSFFTC